MDSSTEFLTYEQHFKTWYEPIDRIAIFVKNYTTGEVLQRIVSAKQAVAPKFQAWIQSLDRSGGIVYSSVNAFRSAADGRTKTNILRIVGVHMEIDRDGDTAVQRLLTDSRVPVPSILISSSPGRYQVFWKARDLTLEQAESVNKALAHEFGGDTAATDATRVLRISGLRNWKYTQPFVVTAHQLSEKTHSLADFQLNLVPAPAPASLAAARPTRFVGQHKVTQSERDWAMVMDRLSRGGPRDVIQRDLEVLRQDKPRPGFYAQLTVDNAIREIQLRKGLVPRNPEIEP
jgi:RepB DNA-primase from phage plasmid